MTDIYSWILSPEVREHLRKTYPLSTLDKTRLICCLLYTSDAADD